MKSPFAPKEGFRYDGLYREEEAWRRPGKSGFMVCQYRLAAVPGESSNFGADSVSTVGASVEDGQVPGAPKGSMFPPRQRGNVSRVIRDTKIGIHVKSLHGHRCQVCGVAIKTATGLYAEAAHIRPLGRPHDGPDVVGNVLCLCPNHHAAFDKGGFSIADDGGLIGIDGQLTTIPAHQPDPEHLGYHREVIFPH